MRRCHLLHKGLVERHGAWQRQTNAVADDSPIAGVSAQLIDRQFGIAEAVAASFSTKIVPEPIRDDLDEVDLSAKRIKHNGDCWIVQQPHHRGDVGHPCSSEIMMRFSSSAKAHEHDLASKGLERVLLR